MTGSFVRRYIILTRPYTSIFVLCCMVVLVPSAGADSRRNGSPHRLDEGSTDIVALKPNEEMTVSMPYGSKKLFRFYAASDVDHSGAYSGGVWFWRTSGLLPSRGYEVKVSWPATNPTAFHFRLVSLRDLKHEGHDSDSLKEESLHMLRRKNSMRMLLNAEKIMFTTPPEGKAFDDFVSETLVEIEAFHEAVPVPGIALPAKTIFNVVLTPTVFGGIPTNIGCVPVLVVVLAVAIYASAKRLVHRLLAESSTSQITTGPLPSSKLE